MAAKKKSNQKTAHNKQILFIAALLLVAVLALLAVEYFSPGSVPFLSGVFSTTDNDGGDKPSGTEAIDIPNALIVYFIDVGQGDSVLLRFPDGTDFLIDAGNGSSASRAEIEDYLARLTATGLDDIEYMIATHPDSDHINMLDDVLAAYEVNHIYYNGDAGDTVTFEKFDKAAKEETYGGGTAATLTLFDGDGDIYIIETESYKVTIYAPGYGRFGSHTNAMSPVIVAEYGGRKLVLSGDAEESTEEWFIEATGLAYLDCDIYKAGHHGSRTSSSAVFLDYIMCEYAVISCAAGNSYGHPHQETLQKLEARAYQIYRTDINGTVTAYIDADGDIAIVTEK